VSGEPRQPDAPGAPGSVPLPMLAPLEPKPEPSGNEPLYRECVADMRRHLQAVRDLPELLQFTQTRALPAAFFEHYNAFLAAYDRLIDYVLKYQGEERQIQCKKGCCNCCIDLVRGITTSEIINIYHHVRPWPDVKQIFEYHRDSAELFTAILLRKIRPGEPPPDPRDQRIAQAHIEFNLQNRPCGFLDRQTGCCRIYPVRPIACRYFFSFDPPDACTPHSEKYLTRRTRTVHLPEEIHVLLREIDRRCGWRPLNYLAGAFCQFAAEVMRTRPVSITNAQDAEGGGGS